MPSSVHPNGYLFVSQPEIEFVDLTTGALSSVPVAFITPVGLSTAEPPPREICSATITAVEFAGLGRPALRLDKREPHSRTFRFEDTEQPAARAVAEWIRGARARGVLHPRATATLQHERIEDPHRIRHVLSFLHERGQLSLDRPHATSGIRRFEGLYSAFDLQIAPVGELPPWICRSRRRSERRMRADPRIRLCGRHPVFPEVHIDCTVRDFSRRGLAVYGSSIQDLLWPGLALEFEVAWRDGRPIKLSGRVQHVTPIAESGTDLIGIALEGDTDPRYAHTVERMLHTGSRAGETSARTLWSLYDESGYFNLSDKTTPDFRPLFESFDRAQSKLKQHPEVGSHFATPGAEAAMHQLQLWDRAWLVFHVARSPRPRRFHSAGHVALATVYLHAYEHVQAYKPRWLVTYVQVAAKWSRRVHVDIPASFVEDGDASITSFTALEVPSDLQLPASQIEVANLAPADTVAVQAALAKALPHPYVQAIGLDALSRPADPRGLWKAADLHRAREVLVARVEQTIVAVAILDSVEPGLHLFRLADSCRIYDLGDAPDSAFTALLAAAAAWFSEQDRQLFVYLKEDPSPALSAIAGDQTHRVRDLGDAWVTVLSADRAPEFLEEVSALLTRTHPLIQRPELLENNGQ